MSAAAQFAVLAVAALVTSFISGILGMAGGMILMGVLLAVVSVPAAMLLHGITQLAANGWRAWLWRRFVDGRIFAGYGLGALAVLALFATIRLVVDKPLAYLLLGATPYLAAALPARIRLDVGRRGQPWLCGAVCTALQLASGVSGPILDVFFVRTALTRQQVVATKAATQSCGHLLKIFYFGGLVSGTADVSAPVAVSMAACALVGTTLSRGVLERMTDADFRRWTAWTVLVIGAFYLANAAWLLSRGG